MVKILLELYLRNHSQCRPTCFCACLQAYRGVFKGVDGDVHIRAVKEVMIRGYGNQAVTF